jgi:O-antigen/teichoic acid export membrane protein
MNNNSLGYRTLWGMVWGYTGKISEFVLAFVFSIIVGRTLGPVIYGRYNLFISVIATFVLFSSFGFDVILNKFVPQLTSEGKTAAAYSLLRKIFVGRFLIISVLGVVAWMSSSFLAAFFSEESLSRYSLFFVLLLLCTGIQNLLISFFNALLKLKEITAVRVLSQLVGLAIMIVLIETERDYRRSCALPAGRLGNNDCFVCIRYSFPESSLTSCSLLYRPFNCSIFVSLDEIIDRTFRKLFL